MQTMLDDNTHFDSDANLFYLSYLFEAMEKTSVGDFIKELQPWKDILDMGMSGTPEKRIEQHPRSEIHPWTAHPVHYYFSIVAGITPASPGFKTVKIAPNLGSLKRIKTTYPTANGLISLDLSVDKKGVINGKISLPEDVTGTFEWKEKNIALVSGTNNI